MAFLIQLVAIIAIFYFILVVPHRREQKRHREMIAALKKGDEVVTTGGLIGEIVQLGDERITVKSGEARLVIERARVARLASEPATTKR
jgi:preprotein translocase subunit YajC